MSPVCGQAVVLGLGQAEVGDPDDAGGVEQQVRGLDVAVEDALRVGVGQRLGHLAADPGHAPEERLPTAGLDRRDLRPARQDRRARRIGAGDSGPGGRRPAAPRHRPEVGPRRVARSRSTVRGATSPAGDSVRRSRTGRSGATRRPRPSSTVARSGAARPSASPEGLGRSRAPGRGVDRLDGLAPGSRSRRSSSMTWSSPWPWMNCMA